MFAATRSPVGRLARAAAVALPFAVMACGGDESSPTIRIAEASTVEPVATAEPIEHVDTRPVLMTGVLVDAARDSGDSAYKAGRYDDAVTAYSVRVESHPGDAQAFYMLGLSHWKAGDFPRAKEAFDSSITLNPRFAKSHFNGARVLLDLKRAPEALELVESGLAIDAASPDGLRLKARAQSAMGEVHAASLTYREMLMRDESDAWGLNNYGLFLMEHDCLQEALRPLARAVQVRPTAPLFLNNLGMALERAGYTASALRYYEEAVRHDSTFTKAVRNLARLKPLVTDSTPLNDISVPDLAEEFRQTIKGWKAEGSR